jgi:hypothetical protein
VKVPAHLIIHRPSRSRGPKTIGIQVNDVHQGDLERGGTLECEVPAGDVVVAEIERGVSGGGRRIVTREGQRVEVHVLYAGAGRWAIAPMVSDRASRPPSPDRLLLLGQAMTTVWSTGPDDDVRAARDDD